MYERILVPTDGSDQARDAIAHALDIASQYGATVHGLYVIDRGNIPSMEPDMREEVLRHFEETSERALADIQESASEADVDVVTATVEGSPSEEIVEYAAENDVDLVVMGTHGRTGLRHVLLGSVAENVARHSSVPVMLVRTPREE